MSPARQHRERFATAMAKPSPAEPIASQGEGGQTPAPPSLVSASPAMLHRMGHAARVAAEAAGGEPAGPDVAAGDGPAAQIQLRLVLDLRRLKEIQSIEKKIEAKREMLPHYRDWVVAQMRAADAAGQAAPDEVLPTIMVWLIDTGDFANALNLAEHVFRFGLALPTRYNRTAPALVVEEIATAAMKAQAAGEAFPLDVLERLDSLTAGADMHDQIRAKLYKAIGAEQARHVEEGELPEDVRAAVATAALATMRRAQQLDDRVGVKGRIQRLEKLLAPPKDAPAPG